LHIRFFDRYSLHRLIVKSKDQKMAQNLCNQELQGRRTNMGRAEGSAIGVARPQEEEDGSVGAARRASSIGGAAFRRKKTAPGRPDAVFEEEASYESVKR
jgi:hypothetical protein